MIKKFLQIDFPQNETDIKDGTPPEIIRLAVDNETIAWNIYDKLDISIRGRPHTAFLHECNHSAAGNAPCTMKELARVEK